MDIKQIEFAALGFYRMCRMHPEICPHDFHWTRTITNKDNETDINYYVCGLCGKETQDIEEM